MSDVLVADKLPAPAFKVEKGFYKSAVDEEGKRIPGIVQLAKLDPSDPDHVDRIVKRHLRKWRIDPEIHPVKADELRTWAESRATLERHLAVCSDFVGDGGLKYGKWKSFFIGSGDSAALVPAFVESEIQGVLLQSGKVEDVIMGTEEVTSNKVEAFYISELGVWLDQEAA